MNPAIEKKFSNLSLDRREICGCEFVPEVLDW